MCFDKIWLAENRLWCRNTHELSGKILSCNTPLIDEINRNIYCHQNTCLYLHHYPFIDYKIMSKSVSESNPSKCLLHLYFLSNMALLCSSYNHLLNLHTLIIMNELCKFCMWLYDAYNIAMMDRRCNWSKYLVRLSQEVSSDQIWQAESVYWWIYSEKL